VGSPADIYERPATPFVAGFLGVSNLLEGRVTAADTGMLEIELAGGRRIRATVADGGTATEPDVLAQRRDLGSGGRDVEVGARDEMTVIQA